MFKVVDEPPSGLQVVQFQQLNATGNQVEQWHRRDLHVLPAVLPGGQEFGISVYGGVFTPSNSLPFLHPIAITMPDGAHVHVSLPYLTPTPKSVPSGTHRAPDKLTHTFYCTPRSRPTTATSSCFPSTSAPRWSPTTTPRVRPAVLCFCSNRR